MKQAKGQHIWLDSKYYHPDLTTRRGSKVNISLPFEQMTGTGAIGRPDLATVEKGQRLFEVITGRIIEFVREFATWPRPRLE